MSLVQEILFTISDYPGGYRMLYDLLYDSNPPSSKKEAEKFDKVVRNTLSRLKKKGLVKNSAGNWSISSIGKKFLSSRYKTRKFSLSEGVKEEGKKVMIVAFDIPEKQRKYRDWLRFELINFGFEQIQKSVWFGPALTEEFIKYLDEIKLLKYLRFFKVSKNDLI